MWGAFCPQWHRGVSHAWGERSKHNLILPVMLCTVPLCRHWAASRNCSVFLFLKDWFLDRKSHAAFSLTIREIQNLDGRLQHREERCYLRWSLADMHMHMYTHMSMYQYILRLAITTIYGSKSASPKANFHRVSRQGLISASKILPN